MLHSGRKWIADQANGEDYFEINEVSTIFFFHGIVIISIYYCSPTQWRR